MKSGVYIPIAMLDDFDTVRKIRIFGDLNIEKFSQLSGIPRSTIYDLESGNVVNRKVHLNAARYAILKHLLAQSTQIYSEKGKS